MTNWIWVGSLLILLLSAASVRRKWLNMQNPWNSRSFIFHPNRKIILLKLKLIIQISQVVNEDFNSEHLYQYILFFRKHSLTCKKTVRIWVLDLELHVPASQLQQYNWTFLIARFLEKRLVNLGNKDKKSNF